MTTLNKAFSRHRKIFLSLAMLLFTVIFLFSVFKLYAVRHEYYLTAKFSTSGPLYINMPVYFRGYNIGKTTKIAPTKDYKYTLVKIVLFPESPKLPDDIVAKVKNHNARKEYIDLMVSDTPSETGLQSGSTIDGEPAFDLEAFLSDLADSGIIVPLLQTFSDTLVSAGKTSDEVRNFFSDSRNILKDNRESLKQTTSGFASTSSSLNKLTTRFNNAITDEKINRTTSSIDKSSANILSASEDVKKITTKVDFATRNIDQTMAKIDCTVSDAKDITSNVKTMTSGLCEVLNKRFAGLRIIFGKPIRN